VQHCILSCIASADPPPFSLDIITPDIALSDAQVVQEGFTLIYFSSGVFTLVMTESFALEALPLMVEEPVQARLCKFNATALAFFGANNMIFANEEMTTIAATIATFVSFVFI
jgi:hypothetical protein